MIEKPRSQPGWLRALHCLSRRPPILHGILDFRCRNQLLPFYIQAFWNVRPHMDAPATWSQHPGTFLGSSQALDCHGSPGRLLDFDQWQVERRFNFALRTIAGPAKQDISNLESCSLSLRIFLNRIRYDALSKFGASWYVAEILRTGCTLAEKSKQKQE